MERPYLLFYNPPVVFQATIAVFSPCLREASARTGSLLSNRPQTNICYFDPALLDSCDIKFGAETVLAAKVSVWAIYSKMLGALRCLEFAARINRVCVCLYSTLKVVPVADFLVYHRRIEMHSLFSLTDPSIIAQACSAVMAMVLSQQESVNTECVTIGQALVNVQL